MLKGRKQIRLVNGKEGLYGVGRIAAAETEEKNWEGEIENQRGEREREGGGKSIRTHRYYLYLLSSRTGDQGKRVARVHATMFTLQKGARQVFSSALFC